MQPSKALQRAVKAAAEKGFADAHKNMDAARKGIAESTGIMLAAAKGFADAYKNMDAAKKGFAESSEIKAAAEATLEAIFAYKQAPAVKAQAEVALLEAADPVAKERAEAALRVAAAARKLLRAEAVKAAEAACAVCWGSCVPRQQTCAPEEAQSTEAVRMAVPNTPSGPPLSALTCVAPEQPVPFV